MANLNDDYLRCASFYELGRLAMEATVGAGVASPAEKAGMETMAASRDQAAEMAVGTAKMIGRSPEALGASTRLIVAEMKKDIDNNYSNMSVLIVKYTYCKDLLDDPSKRLDYWLAKQ